MYQITNLHKAIRSHSVFIQDLTSTEKNIGSGIFVTIKNKYFFFSAEHVIRNDVHISLGLNSHETKFTVVKKYLDRENDIGYIELKEFEALILPGEHSKPCSLGSAKKSAVKTKTSSLAICGFPRKLGNQKPHGIEFPLMFLKVGILSPDQCPEPYKSILDTSKTIPVIYGTKRGGHFMDVDGNITDPIEPYGFSGCGLWYINSQDENDETPNYSLLGIVRSYDEHYQLLLCTPAIHLINKVVEDYGLDFPIEKL